MIFYPKKPPIKSCDAVYITSISMFQALHKVWVVGLYGDVGDSKNTRQYNYFPVQLKSLYFEDVLQWCGLLMNYRVDIP